MSTFDLSSLHSTFEKIDWDDIRCFDHEWMRSQYEKVQLVDTLLGVELLVNRKRKKTLASIQFELFKLDEDSSSVLVYILSSLGLETLSFDRFDTSVAQLKGSGFDCIHSTKTKCLVAMKILNGLTIQLTLVCDEERFSDGIIDFHSQGVITNGVAKSEREEIEGMLLSLDWYINDRLKYERL